MRAACVPRLAWSPSRSRSVSRPAPARRRTAPTTELITEQIPRPVIPNGGASPTSAMVVHHGHLIYCQAPGDLADTSSAPLIAIDVDAPVTAAVRSTPPWTKVLTLDGAQCDRLATDSTHLYVATSRGLVRIALTALDTLLLDSNGTFVPAKTEVVFAATDADAAARRWPSLFGLGATEAYVYIESPSETSGRVLAVPKAGGPSRVVATVPKGGGDRTVSQHWLTGSGEPTIYFVDETRNENSRVVAQDPGGERELASIANRVRLRALTVAGDRLLFVELPSFDDKGRMSLRELRR